MTLVARCLQALLLTSLLFHSPCYASALDEAIAEDVLPNDPRASYDLLVSVLRQQMASHRLDGDPADTAKHQKLEAILAFVEAHDPSDETVDRMLRHNQLLQHMLDIYHYKKDKAEAFIGEHGLTRLLDLAADIDEQLAEPDHPNEPEIKPIDDYFTIKAIDRESEFAFLFVEQGKIDPQSKHLRQYIDRILMASRSSEGEGKLGRSLFVIWVDEERQVSSLEFIPKPSWKKLSTVSQAMQRYWNAVYATPSKTDRLFGYFVGTMQVGSALVATLVALQTGAIDEFTVWPMVLNFIFGSTIGSYNKTYRNIMEASSRKKHKIAKGVALSVVFATIYLFLTGVTDDFSEASSFDRVMMSGGLVAHFYIQNAARIALEERPAIIAKQRKDDAGKWVFKVQVHPSSTISRVMNYPLFVDLQIPTPFAQRAVNNQIHANLKLNFLRQLHLLDVPFAIFIFIAPIPILHWLNIKFTKKKYPNHPDLPKLERDWKESWGLIFDRDGAVAEALMAPEIARDRLSRFVQQSFNHFTSNTARLVMAAQDAAAASGSRMKKHLLRLTGCEVNAIGGSE